MPNGLSGNEVDEMHEAQSLENNDTLGVPTVFKSRPSLVITNMGASIAGLFSPPQE